MHNSHIYIFMYIYILIYRYTYIFKYDYKLITMYNCFPRITCILHVIILTQVKQLTLISCLMIYLMTNANRSLHFYVWSFYLQWSSFIFVGQDFSEYNSLESKNLGASAWPISFPQVVKCERSHESCLGTFSFFQSGVFPRWRMDEYREEHGGVLSDKEWEQHGREEYIFAKCQRSHNEDRR